MPRPTLHSFVAPQGIDTMPKPIAPAGFIIETNASWRTMFPVIQDDICIHCLYCYLVCPDGAIYTKDKALIVDKDFCKGCGICATECPKHCITMVAEKE